MKAHKKRKKQKKKKQFAEEKKQQQPKCQLFISFDRIVCVCAYILFGSVNELDAMRLNARTRHE